MLKKRRFIQDQCFSARREQDIAKTDRKGYIGDIYDPNILEICLDKLDAVREKAERFGVDDNTHADNLGLVYGARYSGRPSKDLFDYYLECLSAAKVTAAEREKRGFASELDCVQKFIAATEKEIRRLEDRRKYVERGRPIWYPTIPDEKPTGEELMNCAMPDSGEMDRLLRYEASLERALDRTLSQLERLQRMRDSQKPTDAEHQMTTSR